LWYAVRQHVVDGFAITLRFKISEPSRNCKTKEVLSDRCTSRGGDGFAVVVQDRGANAIGASGEGLGYAGIPNSLLFLFLLD
jgi:hypothetical protein